MNPTILHDLTKAHTSDLHRQAGRDALSRAAHRARHAPAKHSTPFLPAHTTDRTAHPPRTHPARCPQALACALTAAASTGPRPGGRRRRR